MNKWTLCFAVIMALISCNADNQKEAKLYFSWQLDAIEVDPGSQSIISFELDNQLGVDLTRDNWSIYYNQLGGWPAEGKDPEGLSLANRDGDLFIMKPNDSFQALPSGTKRKYTYKASGIISKFSQLPKGMFLVLDGQPQEMEVNITPLDDNILAAANATTAAVRFADNESLSLLTSSELHPIIPIPKDYKYLPGNKTIGPIVTVNASNGLDGEIRHLRKQLKDLGIQLNEANADQAEITIVLRDLANHHPEAYRLRIDESGINLLAEDNRGIFFGIQSLVQYITLAKRSASANRQIVLKGIEINDEPRFDYRGSHLDVARNFQPKEAVLKILDALAHFKINKFHFHLTDNEGWRLEIPGLPELTEIGSRRGYSPDETDRLMPSYGSGLYKDELHGSGYFSRTDFIEILQYAHDRYIEVIPEIDVPGHARSAIIAMKVRAERLAKDGYEAQAEEYLLHDPNDESEYSSAQNWHDNVICVCRDGAYNFMEKVFEEVVAMYADANVPLTTIHVGGDEQPYGTWQKSPICQEFIQEVGLASTDELPEYFFARMIELMDRLELTISGWEEMVLATNEDGHETTEINPSFLQNNVRAYVWNAIIGAGRDDMIYRLANKGYPVVMCNSSSFYFDMAYDRDPDEIGLSWSGYSNTEKIFRTDPLQLFAYAPIDNSGNALSPEYLAEREPLTAFGRKHFLGIQSQLWSETLNRPEYLEYMFAPKILAFATRAWSPKGDWIDAGSASQTSIYESEWNQMANTIGQNGLHILEELSGGFTYRIPEPGAIVKDGKLHANIAFPGLEIKVQVGEGAATTYSKPISVDSRQTIQLWAVNQKGRKGRIAKLVAP